MKKQLPRKAGMFGVSVTKGETWLEAEEFCYPNGGMTRRAYCIFSDGKKRVVQCGIPDTFFSIPAFVTIAGKRIRGFITSEENGFIFNPTK